ncbi:GNAT family N-acetyltransferase [Desulfovibrio subterraneus]|uniref:GNAT family N-acetyltransferase n=1 Tax=Desulfovibrio subterraneus TaxID=2718620 RepID=UPI0022B86F87|nr:GNAT family N-acetyltransferase [Desulfovibrio subterraneus]WBF66273.1 GNAT family N-acetyltransferase [Desulfovibrio subterraneus]
MESRTLSGGLHATSAPLCSSGGGLLYDTEEVAVLLQKELEELCEKRGWKNIHLRLRAEAPLNGWQHIADKFCTFHIDLAGGEEHVWTKIFRAKTRNQVRKAEKYNFTLHTGNDSIPEFVDLMHTCMKELGSPYPPQNLFVNATKHYSDDMKVLLLKDNGTPIAGTTLFFHGPFVSNPWAVCLKDYHPHCANTLLYWESIKEGIRRHKVTFDLGRSSYGSGTFDFKRRLGATPNPLHIYNRVHQPAGMGLLKTHFPTIWQKLPSFITKIAGPYFLRELL